MVITVGNTTLNSRTSASESNYSVYIFVIYSKPKLITSFRIENLKENAKDDILKPMISPYHTKIAIVYNFTNGSFALVAKHVDYRMMIAMDLTF